MHKKYLVLQETYTSNNGSYDVSVLGYGSNVRLENNVFDTEEEATLFILELLKDKSDSKFTYGYCIVPVYRNKP